MTAPAASEIVDVAVVGGGVAGTYAAWRVKTADPGHSPILGKLAGVRNGGQLRVALYELSDRVGGRLLSVTPPSAPQTVCELGGMGYMTSHQLARALVETKLQIPSQPLNLFVPDNLLYVRGRRLRYKDLASTGALPYNLRPTEQGHDLKSLFLGNLQAINPGFGQLEGAALRDAVQTSTFQGRPLADWGFWNLLSQLLSQEAIELVRDTTGYDIMTLNWNAADTILMDINFIPDDTHHALAGGYERLPQTLATLFAQAGGTVSLGHRLRSCDAATLADGTSGVRLQFDDGVHGRAVIVEARAVVLAMPRRALELLDRVGAVFGPRNGAIGELISSVTPVPMFKIALCYPNAWWMAANVIPGGVSITDLPLRNCYYWNFAQPNGAAPPTGGPAVLLASGDVRNVDYWAGLRNTAYEPPFQPPAAAQRGLMGEPTSTTRWEQRRAPEGLVREMHRQLVEMHGIDDAPEPTDAVFADWVDDPYGGGVHTWNIHVRSWETMPRMLNPKPGIPVFVCGEAYSQTQGWVEGALETAEAVLQQYLGIPAPDWLSVT